tara:strand:+ start:84 stop:452 length:369 start_codon:yes stop_codon:yes gene_type:complete
MASKKTPDNIIQFPKKFKRPANSELEKDRAKRIQQEHQKIFCQAMCDEITENILIKLHSENISVTDKKFLADYKLVSESIKSMLLRTQKLKHPLQPRIDKSIDAKTDKDGGLYAITIDYDKF